MKARLTAITALFIAVVVPAGADVVRLKNGQSLEGVVVEADGQVKIHSAVGTIGFPADLVLRIERGDSLEQQTMERLRALSPNDVQGRVDIALELERAGATTLAQRVYESVLDRDPDDPTARRALGYVRCDDEWLSAGDCHRSRGEVLYQGEWVTADQKAVFDALDQERRRSELERLRSSIEVESARLKAERDAAAMSYGGGYDPYYYDNYYGGYPYYPIYPGYGVPPLRPIRGDGDRGRPDRPIHHGNVDRGRPSSNGGDRVQPPRTSTGSRSASTRSAGR